MMPGSENPESPAKLIIYVYGDQRKIGPQQDSYESTVALCRDMFPALFGVTNVAFYTKDPDICNGRLAEIYEEIWKDVVGQLREVVIMDQRPSFGTQDGTNLPSTALNQGSIEVFVTRMDETNVYRMDLTSSVRQLKTRIQQRDGTLIDQQVLTFGGRSLDDYLTLGQYNIRDGSDVQLSLVQPQARPSPVMLIRKPVIYLLTPVSVEASVDLSLAPQWSLSAIYPVAPIKSGPAGMGQCVSWRVRVHPEGHLTELSTGLDIAYLYWEALANTPLPSSPPASPLHRPTTLELGDEVQSFDPTNADLNDQNAVVIAVNKVTPYLDAALKALGLHIEARTSFITYWLPSLLKHEHIAFSFLPQASYERAAPLSVSPTPDVVTRIFMVFKGIAKSELRAWPEAQKRLNDDVSSWIDKVGVDVGRTVDEGLFRVIEWGGMEISSTDI